MEGDDRRTGSREETMGGQDYERRRWEDKVGSSLHQELHQQSSRAVEGVGRTEEEEEEDHSCEARHLFKIKAGNNPSVHPSIHPAAHPSSISPPIQ